LVRNSGPAAGVLMGHRMVLIGCQPHAWLVIQRVNVYRLD